MSGNLKGTNGSFFFRQWLFLSLRSRNLLKFCSLKYTYLGFKKLQVFLVFFSLVLHRTLF